MTVTAVVLAAGRSSRFGPQDKLTASVDGVTLVRRAAEAALASTARGVIVVTGANTATIKQALAGLPVHIIENGESDRGMSSSIKAGIAALTTDATGVVIMLGDMPGVEAGLIDCLIAAFETDGCEKIVFPCDADGRQGHPVVWPRAMFTALSELQGDRGGKSLLEEHASMTRPILVSTSGAFIDIDTPADLASYVARNR